MCMGVLGLDWYRVSGGYSIELASCATSRAQSGNLGTWTSEVVDAPDELFYQAVCISSVSCFYSLEVD
jgi:hypothetical protein